MAIKVEAPIGGQTFSLEAGKLAEQADGAVLVRYGDTVLLATAVSAEPREGIDFFPMTVDYEERMYAAGKIPGGFIKRESRPSEAAILAMRLTDRPIRPLFPKGYKQEVQIVLTVLSADQENDPDILAVNGASAALAVSSIPFLGPIGAVRVGRINGEFVTNPTTSQLDESDLDLVVAGTREAVMMVEAGRQDPARVGHGRCDRLRPGGAPAEHRPAGEAGRHRRQAEEAAVPRPEGRLGGQARQGAGRRRDRVRRLRPRDDRLQAGERLHRRHRRPQGARRRGGRPLRVAGQPRPLDRGPPDPRHQRRAT